MRTLLRKIVELAVLLVAGFGLAALSGMAISAAAETTAPETTSAPEAADPTTIEVDGTWYLYGTSNGWAHVPVWSSTDRVTWTYRGDALPVLPDGVVADPGMVWAPEVAVIDGELLLYTTLFDAGSTRPCIWVAGSTSPEGPFSVTSEWPLVCDEADGGAIDADVHQAGDGTWWLAWKADGNCCGLPATIRSQQLDGDGRSLLGTASDLLTATEAWQDGIVEGPSMMSMPDGRELLVYAGGTWEDDGYATGAAICDGPTGPCTPVSTEPVLQTDADQLGPGGADLVLVEDRPWLTYHSWAVADDGSWTRLSRMEALPAPSGTADAAQ